MLQFVKYYCAQESPSGRPVPGFNIKALGEEMRRTGFSSKIFAVSCLAIGAGAPAHAITCAKYEISKWTGAYYRKLVSTPHYSGISAVVTLPEFTTDPQRVFPFDPANPKHLPKWDGPLDAASVYLGTNHGGSEIDTGVNYKPVYVVPQQVRALIEIGLTRPADRRNKKNWYMLNEVANPPTLKNPRAEIIARGWTEIAEVKTRLGLENLHAFIPFWRTNQWNDKSDVPFFSGERIRLGVEFKGAGKFVLTVGLEEEAAEARFTQIFYHARFKGAARGSLGFKRVNSIDQFTIIHNGNTRVGNEMGRIPDAKIIPTSARAMGLHWERVNLISKTGSLIPFTGPACKLYIGRDVYANRAQLIHVYGGDPSVGGERVDITPIK
jgi:hypothetical protein